MPPHAFLGFTIGEWVGIVGLLTTFFTVVGIMGRWGIKYAQTLLIEPLRSDLKRVSKSIDELTESSKVEHKGFENRLDQHDRTLDVHGQQIKSLEKEVFRHEN